MRRRQADVGHRRASRCLPSIKRCPNSAPIASTTSCGLRVRMGDRELPAARADRRGVRADTPVRGPAHRHRASTSSRRPSRCCSRWRAAGREVISTGNLNTTQQEALDYLGAHGVRPVGAPTSDPAEHDAYLREVLAAEPQLLLDNGGDLFVRWLERPYEGLVGGTEETTSGRMRLEPLRARLEPPDPGHQRQPDQAVRREPARRRPEHGRVVPADHEPLDERQARHRLRLRRLRPGRRRALPERLRRGLGGRDRPGHAARGAARRLRGPGQGRGASRADVVITATGARGVVTAADLPLLADDVVLMNVGHFPLEIDVPAVRAAAAGRRATRPTGSRRSGSPAAGASTCSPAGTWSTSPGPRPLGNSIESMDLGFALQARCLEAVATRPRRPRRLRRPGPGGDRRRRRLGVRRPSVVVDLDLQLPVGERPPSGTSSHPWRKREIFVSP